MAFEEHAFEVQVPWCLGTKTMVVIGFVTHSSDSYFSITVSVPQEIELTSDTHHGHTVLLFPRNNILKGDKGLSDRGPAMGVRMTQVAKRTSQCGEWIAPTIRDQQEGGALAFLTQRDVLPAQWSCTPGQDPSQRASGERGSEDSSRHPEGMDREMAFCFHWLKAWRPQCPYLSPAPLLGQI